MLLWLLSVSLVLLSLFSVSSTSYSCYSLLLRFVTLFTLHCFDLLISLTLLRWCVTRIFYYVLLSLLFVSSTSSLVIICSFVMSLTTLSALTVCNSRYFLPFQLSELVNICYFKTLPLLHSDSAASIYCLHPCIFFIFFFV